MVKILKHGTAKPRMTKNEELETTVKLQRTTDMVTAVQCLLFFTVYILFIAVMAG